MSHEKPIQPQDKFVLRMPDGLRDRIKRYAEAHDRSMNAEIIRVLEREFPAPWTLEQRTADLLRLVTVLKAGANEAAIGRLVDNILETVRGMASGRVEDLDEATRNRIRERLETWDEDEISFAHDEQEADFDEEELAALNRGERTAKIARVKPSKDVE